MFDTYTRRQHIKIKIKTIVDIIYVECIVTENGILGPTDQTFKQYLPHESSRSVVWAEQ